MSDNARTRTTEPLRWSGLALMLVAATARGLTPFGDLPHWDLDPMQVGAPTMGIGPAGSLVFDVVALLGAGLALLGEALAGRRMLAVPSALAAIGAVGVVLHGWVLGGGGLGNQRVGASWAAAVACGLAAMHLAREVRFRRLIVAAILAFVSVLAIKGAQQVLIEHPQTVDDYRRNRETMLAAQGWTADSPMARQYERRLMQAEASGWYGLANVYASVAAAGVLLGFGLLSGWVSRRGNETGRGVGTWTLAVVLGLGAAIAALAMSGSKGGVMAVMLGLAVAGTAGPIGARLGPRAKQFGGWLGVAMVGLPLALVVVRGVVGERVGELSLLFRWFYAEAAVKIGLAHPLGVGPDGFQRAYQLAKSPLSPEDVKSPHAILLDYSATLGVLGLGWCVLLLWCMWTAGRAAAPTTPPTSATPPLSSSGPGNAPTSAEERDSLPRMVCLLAAVATIVGAWLDRGYMTLDGAAVRVLGLMVWCLVGVGTLRLLQWLERTPEFAGGATLALFGAAAALAAHGQIDVVASWPGSAALFWMVIGAAAACGLAAPPAGSVRAAPGPWLIRLMPGLVALLLAGLVALKGAAPSLAWEARLASAAARVSGLGQMQREAAALAAVPATPQRDEGVRALARELSVRLGRPVEPTLGSLRTALDSAIATSVPSAIDDLLAAQAVYPDEWRVGREASRLALLETQVRLAAGDRARAEAAAARAVQIAQGPDRSSSDAGGLVSLGLVYQARGDLLGVREDYGRAVEALERAMALDPYNLDIAMRLMRLSATLGDRERGARWARRALELDEQSRLDRQAHGLRENERLEAVGMAGKP